MWSQRIFLSRVVGGLIASLALGLVHAQNREAAPGNRPTPDVFENGGPDCSAPTVIYDGPPTSLPFSFTDSGDTCGKPAVVSDYANSTCNSRSYPGPEAIYLIDLAGQHNAIAVRLTPGASADLGLFMVPDCNSPTSCVDFHDAIGPGAVSRLPNMQVAPYPSGIYFIYVDSYYATGRASCGPYELSAGGTTPVELLHFSIE